ncbi:MAG: TonB-dependent receptor [Ignavibacteria bacterium]|nr:TonB-dependent receptor [Ignavibacteria bacterium]
MTKPSRLFFCATTVVLSLTLGLDLRAQSTGSISGKVIDEATGESLPSVNITVKGATVGASSDESGKFSITNIPTGTYTLVASLIGHITKEIPSIEVRTGETATRTIYLKDETVQVGGVVVFGASFRRERITEAPSAVSTLEPDDIRLNAGQGQLPKLLETTPGVDIAQNGLYDFNINTRGFNSSLTRRLLVLLDGRDLSIVFLGAQEWNGLSVPIEDLGKIELVRGPGSALYGANAFNGVINIITPSPKQIVGTKLTVAGGQLSTFRGDVRYAGTSGRWSYKLNFGRFQGDTWSVSRLNPPFEYDGFVYFLNSETRPLNTNPVASTYGSARLDYDIDDNAVATAEGGLTQVENEVYITGIGRVQVTRALKPWGRISYNDDHSTVQVWASGRNSTEPQYSLSTGLQLHETSFTSQGDYQYHLSVLDDRVFITSGLSYRYQTTDSRGTLMLDKHKDNMTGIYAQLEYKLTDQMKAVAASRWDRSTLYPSQISPKVAVVWSPHKDHSLRATYNKAFQAPNYSEQFLYVLHPTRALAYLGNSTLTVEKISGYEVGYKGIFNNALFVTVDAYYNELKDFITDLAPGVNPSYAGQEFIGGTLRTVWSYGNAGKVTESGFELGLNYYLSDDWILNSNYSLFGFSIIEKNPNDVLLPNAPDFKMNGGITYRNANGYEAGVTVKYVPSFDWAAGIYQGRILAYTLVNLVASYKLTPNIQFGLNVSNLLDREHYEIFGGSLLKRRAIGTVTMTL